MTTAQTPHQARTQATDGARSTVINPKWIPDGSGIIVTSMDYQ